MDYYGTSISEHITKKPNGGIICTAVPVARTGTQEYFARELRLDGDPERVIRVTREPEEVFSQTALASFEGCAVTDGHPPENVTAENFSAYARGHAQNVRRSGDYVVADLHIDDAALASDVLNHVKREISCGYLCTYAPAGGGYTQKGILGNHIAVVSRGRAGSSVSIKDAVQETGKGRKYMSKFAEAILSAFGMAAKEAKTQEEIDGLVSTAAIALDAQPAAKTPESAGESAPSQTAVADALGEKLDKVIEMLDALKPGEKPDAREDSKKDDNDGLKKLDDELKKLGGDGDVPAEEASDACLSGEAKDAAVAIIRSMRPVVAAIEDRTVQAQVTDALLSSIRDQGKMGEIAAAAQAGAQRAADQAAMTSYEKRCADSESAYAARNPHKRQEKEV